MESDLQTRQPDGVEAVREKFQQHLDYLQQIAPDSSEKDKVEALLWCMRDDNFLERVKQVRQEQITASFEAIDTTILETKIGSPNIIIYAIIWIGMNTGGWFKLSVKQREVIRLYIFNSTSMQDIAKSWQVSKEAVRERYFVGLGHLRAHAISLFPSFAKVFQEEDVKRKSTQTDEYIEARRERMFQLNQSEAISNRRTVIGPGRGHKGHMTEIKYVEKESSL